MNQKGNNNPNWKGGKISLTCKNCVKNYFVFPSEAKLSIKHFCSWDCRNNWNSNNQKGENNPAWKGGLITLNCLVCDKSFKVFPSQNKNGRRKYCSQQCMGNGHGFQKEKNNINWKDGISKLRHTARNIFMQTIEYKNWRKDVFERDNYTCQLCKIKGGKLRANHIKKYADYPDLRIVITNGITIHESCDLKLVMYHEEEWEDYFNNILKGGKQLLQI